jgi:hypothetical protein
MKGIMSSQPPQDQTALGHAVAIVTRVCQIAAKPTFLTDLRTGLREAGVLAAIEARNTPALFDWLMWILSFQGIADGVAEGFIEKHGNVTWTDVEQALALGPTCPKLGGHWRFHDCQYQKGRQTCAEPRHFDSCPLPNHSLRNGHLNQLAYSLFLFLRDLAEGDFVGWIDRQLKTVHDEGLQGNRLRALRDALVGPMKGVYGISHKVAAMALSMLLLGHGRRGSLWFDVGRSFVVVDTLVHNFMHRTGILRRFQADHPYGPKCYAPHGCADILEVIADQIDARSFNRAFPQAFPRFVQSTLWRYCAQRGFNICNGNNIDDFARCDNEYCRVRSGCDRIPLKS